MHEPWRNLVAHLHAAFGENWQRHIEGTPLVERLDRKPIDFISNMIAKQVNAPLASSCGRLFDAVAAAVGVTFDRQHYEGQAAMELEAIAHQSTEGGGYDAALSENGVLSWRPLWEEIMADLNGGVDHPLISARFHNGLASALVDAVARVASGADTDRVVLYGGAIQNRILHGQLQTGLRTLGFDVMTNQKLPCGDGNISLGQAGIASLRG